MSFIRRNHKDIVEVPPAEWEFELGGNLIQAASNSPQLVWSNLDKNRGGFGTVSDPGRAGLTQVAVNATDRYPSEDFGMVLPRVPFSASAQVLHCRLNGLASIAVTPSSAWTISGTSVSGDDTVFDLNIAAGNPEDAQATLIFTNTKRTALSSTNTGCRGIYIRSPGIALDDPAQLMPYMAAALAPFGFIRYMQPLNAWTDVYTRTPSDRATPTHKPNWVGYDTAQTVSMEEVIQTANQLNKNAWINITTTANDALIREWAEVVRDNLNPGLYAIFEYANETWNLFLRGSWWPLTQAMNEVNGYVWQYCVTKFCSVMTKVAGTVTAEFDLPDGHGCAPGDIIYTNSMAPVDNIPPPVNGYKTILTTPSATVCTWFEGTGVDYTRRRVAGNFRSGPLLVSCDRLGTVMTIVFGKDHGMTAGVTQVKAVSITGLSANLTTISTTPTARSITMPCTAGVDGPISLNGGSSLCAGFTSQLNSYDKAQDQHILALRWVARRAKEMSVIVQDVFGSDFGVRAKVCVMNQAGNNQYDQMTFINTVFGPPTNYFHAIGTGNYPTLNGSSWPPTPNLRDLTTYNGNTPPSMQDYADTWETTALHVKDATGATTSNYDNLAMTARWYGLEMWNYEWAHEASSTNNGNIPGAAGTAAGLQKNNTLNDAIYAPAYNQFLDTLEISGFQKVTVFQLGTCPVGSSDYTKAWSIYRDFTTPTASVRFNALVDRKAAARTGPTRNLLSLTLPVTIDGRAVLGVWPYPSYSGAFPPAVIGTQNYQNWIITVPEDGDWTFVPTFTLSSGGTRNIIVQVNAVSLSPNYSIPIGTNTQVGRVISLTKGHNVIRTIPGTSNPGALVTVNSFLFTPV